MRPDTRRPRRSATVLLLVGLGALGGCRAPVQPPAPPPVSPRHQPPAPSVTPPAAPTTSPLAFDRVQTARRLVALTFDCCEASKPAGFDRRIVSFLMAHQVPATFFLGGRWIERHPQATRLLASAPYFELDNHSYLHPHMTRIPRARVREELAKTQQLLEAQAGRPARFFRPPYGEWNASVRAEVAGADMATVTWTIATGDPDRHVTAQDILAEARRAKPGAVIIMHANGRGWHTAEALPQIVAWLRAHDLQPVTLAELVKSGQPHEIQPRH